MKYSDRDVMVKAQDKDVKDRQLIELKCFLRKPMEANLQILVEEFNMICKGKSEESEVAEQEPIVEQAKSLEDWFNELV